MTAAVYVHIPFCLSKCLYCDFNSYPGMEHLFAPYVEAVRAEIRAQAERFPDARVPTVYVGGGTPNVLAPDQLASILAEIRRSFRVDDDAEITTEANPGARRRSHTLTLPDSHTFTRLSLGVQSFDDEELRLLGRIHTSDEAVRAFREAREAGFLNIGLDLMYGIAGQTRDSWRAALCRALELGPEHISLYSLSVEEGTPFHAMQVEGRLTLPGSDAEADMYEDAISRLSDSGFVHYEISNFARPGFECRHNLTYWRNDPYFGFGCGATGFLPEPRSTEYEVQRPNSRQTNVANPEEYVRRIETGESPRVCEERLTGRAAMGETMFLGLRMLAGVEIESFARRHGILPQEAFAAEIDDLNNRGLIEVSSGTIRLTHTGILLANEVFEQFV